MAEPLGPLDLDRRPTAEMVADALRARLLAGDYQPGEPVRETKVAAQLKVSRPTAREGLLYLVREGLLTHHLHSGMTVAGLGVDDIRDLYQVRLALESAGIRRLMQLQGPVELGRLGEAHENFRGAVEASSGAPPVSADMEFHAELVRLSGSRRLVEFHRASVRQLRLVLSQFDRKSGDLDRQIRDHQQLLEAIESGRYDDALRDLSDHLGRAADDITAFISAAGGNR